MDAKAPAALLDDDVVAGSAVEHVLPGAADQDVVAGTAGQGVIAGTADQDVIAVAAIGGEQDAGRKSRRLMTSSPPRPLITMRSLASKFEIVTVSARPVTVTTPLLLGDIDDVIAVGAR